jgi:tRNA(Ile2) C34 agmatinyltransferase TiaS
MKRIYHRVSVICPVCGVTVEVTGEDFAICPHCSEMWEIEEERRGERFQIN